MPKFFNRLNYSFGNEDWKTERKALSLKSTDRAICITASGDRPLNLLMDDCHEIVSVDLNPYQNYLLNLKMASMLHFDFEQYLLFLGSDQCSSRLEMLKKIVPFLNNEAARYWENNEEEIQKGVLYQGAIEKWTKTTSFLIKMFRKNKIEQLFSFDDLNEQKRFVREKWNTKTFKKCFEIALNPLLTGFFLKDPGLHKNLDQSLTVGHYIYDRMNKSLETCLAKKNPLLSLICLGKVLPPAYPPYLTQQGTSIIKEKLNRIKVITHNIIDYLESSPDSYFDAFSLSDVASYLNPEDFQRLVYAIYRTAKPGARFCLREFLSDQSFPEHLVPFFVRDHKLEKELEEEDRCFVYRFMTGQIVKKN